MASALDFFRVILRKLLFSTGSFFRHLFRRWTLFLAFLGRKSGHLGVWSLWDHKKRGTFPKTEQDERPPPSTETGLGSAGYAIVAASSVPASVSCPNLETISSVTVARQPQRAASVTIPPSDRDIRNSQPTIYGLRRRLSSDSGVANVGGVNPSRDSHSRGFFADQAPRTEEPHALSSLADHSSCVVDAALDASAREGPLVFPDHPTAPPSSSPLNIALPEGRFLELLNSALVPRSKEVTVSRESAYKEIPPLTRIFPYISHQTGPGQGSRLEDCAPWVPASHPDGSLYFFDQERRLFTDTDMLNPELRKEIEDFYILLQRILARRRVDIPSNNYDLTLDITPANDGRIRWSYYYACLETRCLFWLHPHDTSDIGSELFSVSSPAHIKHRLEALYWSHWSLFPANFDGRHLDRRAVDELVGILSYGYLDMIISKSVTLPFDGDTMQKMLTLVKNANKSDAGLVYHTVGVARLLSIFAYRRFIYSHGQSSAGFERHGTVHTNSQRKRTFPIKLVSLMLFRLPEGYLRELEGILVPGKIVGENNWRNFVSGLLKEWEQLILPSTVLLTVNIGFLAIPGVNNSDSGGNDSDTTTISASFAQIACYVSVVTSIGGIIIGLLLNRHSSPEQNKESGEEYYIYCLREGSRRGIILRERLAIVFSLPWALIMWSMIWFFIGLFFFMSNTASSSAAFFIVVAITVIFDSVIRFLTIPRRPGDVMTRRVLRGLASSFTLLWESLSLATHWNSRVRSRLNHQGAGTVV